jgi:PAS domain S-box-containing protein
MDYHSDTAKINPGEELELFRLVFDSFVNGALITDAAGYITHFNKPYGRFLGIDPEKYIGRHCTEVIENSRMHIVGKTGIPEINQTQRIKNQDMLVHRIPIKKDEKIIAVFGLVMFQNIREISKLAERTSVLESKVQFYEQELRLVRSTRYTIDSIIGTSRAIKGLKKEALKATANKFPVLITGESGTGKELFAQSIHHGSSRNIYPFVRINCAAIPENLLESELFGYEKGAFTGANTKGKPGKFELAHRGTIFLDEIGDLPMEMQPKLLRVLEEKEFERVGGNTLITSDFRLVSATNGNLEEMMELDRFRRDLYYRMNVIHIHIPPLRDRKEDILHLIRHLLNQMSAEMYGFEIKIDEEASMALMDYHWPGNVRELSNVLERATCVLEGDTIHLHNLPFNIYRGKATAVRHDSGFLKDIITRAEKEAICFALKESDNNKAKAAAMLGIHRTLLYKKMERHGIALTPEGN